MRQLLRSLYTKIIVFLSPKIRLLIKKNINLKNTFLNKKVIVLGNGPSLRKVDFDKISNQKIITVNRMFLLNDFKKISPIFHVITDPIYSDLENTDYSENLLISQLRLLSFNTKILLPMGLYKFALKHLNVKNCYFIYTHGLLNSNRNIDLTKIIPQFASVIQTAIILSIYLGFKEIKLSGVDMTNFLSLINEQSAYAFDMKKDILLDKYKKSKTFDNHSFLQGIAYMFRDFKLIYSYCLRKNIYIQNCSTPTVLDSIPRGNPEDLYD